MKKFMNESDLMLRESLSGLVEAYPQLLRVEFEPTFVARRERASNKVALVSGGGSGHEPLHAGFVGAGMLDAACPGQVFTSPTPDQMLAAAAAAEAGRGVLFIVKNYAGDRMNFEIAGEMLEIDNATVLVNDDVAVENSEQGASLLECKALAERVNAATASMGVAFTSCTVPAAGRPTFDIGPDEIEIGVGIHGEPGRRRAAHQPADEIVRLLMDAILADLKTAAGRSVLLHVNGFGGTPLMELYLLHHGATARLKSEGLAPLRSLVGNYTTSLDMAGASLTVTLLDDELTRLWDAPVHTAALRW